MNNSVEAFPLHWPVGWPRTKKSKPSRYQVTFDRARRELENELRLMGATGLVLSSDVPIRKDGAPHAGAANRYYEDPGVAIYFKWNKEPWVVACDTWDKVRDNVRAIGLTIAALRSIERSGATELLKRAFTGFKALPAVGGTDLGEGRTWWGILGCRQHDDAETVKDAYRESAKEAHPDRGGLHEDMIKINLAWDIYLKSAIGRLHTQ